MFLDQKFKTGWFWCLKCTGYLPTSTRSYPYLPIVTHIYPQLPICTRSYINLPIVTPRSGDELGIWLQIKRSHMCNIIISPCSTIPTTLSIITKPTQDHFTSISLNFQKSPTLDLRDYYIQISISLCLLNSALMHNTVTKFDQKFKLVYYLTHQN